MPLQLLLDLAHELPESADPFYQLEVLRIHQSFDSADPDILERLLHSDDHLIAAAAFRLLRFSGVSFPDDFAKFLNEGATHPSQHVRREAAVCASYLGLNFQDPSKLLKAIAPVLDQPAGPHLAYAIRSSYHSAALKPHWLPGTAEKLAALTKPKAVEKDLRTRDERKFDRQKNLATLKIGTIPERLLFTKDKLTAKAGQPVKLVFSNPDVTEHNLLLLAKDTPIQEIGEAANLMAADPEAAKKHYIPDDKRVLHATQLLKQGETQTLRFTAPTDPGNYPYLCTFPGHWTIMKGELIVE